VARTAQTTTTTTTTTTTQRRRTSLALDLRAHSREQQHLLDVVAVAEQHGHAVDAETPAGGRRQTVLQREAEALVVNLATRSSGGAQ
jgi:hypothetical protein